MEPLLDEDFKDGKGIVFIGMHGEGDKAKFEVADEAKAFLETLKAPIALASIVGRYRTGKSFLVNRMLLDVVGKGFQVGATVNSCTKGLWMWNKPLRCRNKDGTEVNLLIIDTEGIGSLDADADHDAKIFAMALLLSSYFIYNSTGSIDESALNNLSLVVELTKHIRTKAGSDQGETGENFSQFFPSFLWVVRDFALMLVDESGAEFTSKQYLERSLTPTQGFSEGVEVKNRIRRMLLAFFPDRDCVTLKRPVEDESMLQKLDTVDWGDLRPEFVQQVTTLRNKIYSSAPPKTLNGKALDGHMLAWLAEAYSKSINEGAALNIGDAWAQVSKSKNQKAVTEAISLYEALAEECKKKELPVSTRDLETKHAEFHQKAVKLLRFNSIGDDLEVFTTEVDEKVQKVYAELKTANDTMAREAATAAAEAAYAPVGKMVEEGGFASVHDYDLERKKVKAALVEEVPDTSVKMEVLHCYMEAKLSDAANKIEAKKDLEREKEVTELKEKLSETEHAKEQMRLTLEKEVGEAKIMQEQTQEKLKDAEMREADLRENMERETGALKAQLEEVQIKLGGEVKTLKEKLEEEEKTGKEALAKAKAQLDEVESQMGTKVALMEREKEFNEKRMGDLETSKKDLEASVEKEKKAAKEAKEQAESASKTLTQERDQLAAKLKATQTQLEEAKQDSAEKESALQDKYTALESRLKAAKESAQQAEGSLEAARNALQEELAELKKTSEEQAAAAKAALEKESARAMALEASLNEAKVTTEAAMKTWEAEKLKLEEEKEKLVADAKDEAEKASKEKAALEASHKTALEAADAKYQEATAGAEAGAKEAGERASRLAAAEGRVGELETLLKEKEEEIAKVLAGKEEAVKAAEAAAQAQAAAAAAAAAAETQAKKSANGDMSMEAVVGRQARMQEEHTQETMRLSTTIEKLEEEKGRYVVVIQKLSSKIEEANRAGFKVSMEDIAELKRG
eukprot:CAMPEP_0206239688 /NCGR_PEP_ID=MMETSP0047_2-20121206/15526_1 /ASSEMBLY_ACC=CAM_ASM_000192 /TAXON_ID=195065 /ORGANISM="Chroomonas mesostigmatica_cf, Strain CCMP1168" /LENGTH=971 /DNA_ID=CAMNT_0053664395 /DNA_START=45 /DNA_END=2956 /DNA_ORIENTATION=-